MRRRIVQLPRSSPYVQPALVLALSVAYFSAGVRPSGENQSLTSAILADSVTDDGFSCLASQASGLPAARSLASAAWVKPVPRRFR